MTDHQAKVTALGTKRIRLERSLRNFLNQGDTVVRTGPSLRKLPGRWVDAVMLGKDGKLYTVWAVPV